MYLLLTLFAVVIVLLSITAAPISARIAKKIGGLDIPEARKAHRFPTPRMGGLGITILFFSCVLGLLLTGWLHLPDKAAGFLFTLSVISFVGLMDDVKSISARSKLVVEILLAGVVYYSGLRVSGFAGNSLFVLCESMLKPLSILTESQVTSYAGMLSQGIDLVLTVTWFIVLSNAMNLVDGLDGLATTTGISIAGFLSLSLALTVPIIFHVSVWIMLSLFIFILIGFLHWNRPPAVIFLGDSGSLFIGWFLAGMSLWSGSVMAPQIQNPWLILSGFCLLFGYPISDTVLSIIRRLSNCISTNNSNYITFILTPDRLHLHHRMNPDGKCAGSALSRLTLLNLTFGLLAISSFSLAVFSSEIHPTPPWWIWLRYLPLAAGCLLLAFLMFRQHADTITKYIPLHNTPLPPTT